MPKFAKQFAGLSLKHCRRLAEFSNCFPVFPEGRQLFVTNSIPMFLVNAKEIQAEHDCIVLAETVLATPGFNRALKVFREVDLLHGGWGQALRLELRGREWSQF